MVCFGTQANIRIFGQTPVDLEIKPIISVVMMYCNTCSSEWRQVANATKFKLSGIMFGSEKSHLWWTFNIQSSHQSQNHCLKSDLCGWEHLASSPAHQLCDRHIHNTCSSCLHMWPISICEYIWRIDVQRKRLCHISLEHLRCDDLAS